MGAMGDVKAIGFTIVASALLILLGLVYFMINLWIVKVGSGMLGYTDLSANWGVLAAALLTVGGVVGSTIRK